MTMCPTNGCGREVPAATAIEEPSFEIRYRSALTVYVRGELDDALTDALEIGRNALAKGHGLLRLLTLHHALLASLVEQSAGGTDLQVRLARAKDFFVQVSAPFESAHHQWHELADRLQSANEELETQVEERTKAHREAVERLEQAQQAASAARAELDHATRLMARGEMAAAIAHEINQPLTAIIAQANAAIRWLARNPPDVSKSKDALEKIVAAGHRASDVVGSIRAMFKRDDNKRIPIDTNDIIRETVTLAQSDLRAQRVEVQINLAHDLPRVLGDRIQIQQVVFNLVMNAVDAMRSVTGRPRMLKITSAVQDDGNVTIAVEDSGGGIDPSNVDRIFGPFYTTKPQGMGMGLSICRSIVEAHDGRIWVSSHRDFGSSFHIALPKSSGI
jgi:C4-dicarboxylate-specific signal transduction histidine kinase